MGGGITGLTTALFLARSGAAVVLCELNTVGSGASGRSSGMTLAGLKSTHLLGRMAKLLPTDWQQLYGPPLCYLESFVDPQRFAGTSYKAANTVLTEPPLELATQRSRQGVSQSGRSSWAAPQF